MNNADVTVTSGSFSYAVTLQNGTNTLTVVATDTLGNATTDTRTITLDATAPLLTFSTPADNSKTAQSFTTVSGTVNETSTVTVAVNGGIAQTAAMNGTSYSATVNLSAGTNTIAITATDLANNTSNAARTIIRDNSAPSLAVTNPSQDITVAVNTITISGTVSDTYTTPTISISFNNQTFTPTVTSGAFSQQLTFTTEGTWPIVVTAADETGNTASVTRNIIYAIPNNGTCGTSNNATLTVAPTTYLCSNGTPSSVTGTGPWNWNCNGSNGGSTANCSASIQTYTLTFVAGSGGSVSGTSPQTVKHGSSATSVTATPASGYTFTNWTGTNGFVTATANPLTSTNVTANQTVTANFTLVPPVQFTVTPTTGTGYTFTPAATQTVTQNVTTSFTISPASGYGIAAITGCNGNLNGTTYTTGAITANCSITVTTVARTASTTGTLPTMNDALKTLQAVAGVTTLSAADKIRYDVAPLNSSGTPIGNGTVDLADVIMILRRSIGIGTW